MKKVDLKLLAKVFFSWRILLFVFLIVGLRLLPAQSNFLGGGSESYSLNPYIWAWSNFDGEHYLSIAQNGYQPLTYFFFPFYPLLISFIGQLMGGSLNTFNIAGQLISNMTFIVAMFGLWKIVRIDHKRKVAINTLILLVLFPTSYYFASVYTESLFLALAVWSFYAARQKKWFYAGLLGGLASATRIIGLALIPALLIEYWQYTKPKKYKKEVLLLLLIPLGLLVYMVYLYRVTGDPLEFFNTVSIFGEQRSSSLILFPQVFYRYIFKILPNLNYSYFPVVFTTWLEFITAGLFLTLSVVAFKKLRLSYALYMAVSYLVPTLAGSFSSMPRYILIIFPGFLLFSLWFTKRSRIVRTVILLGSTITLLISTILFTRGFWVS